MKSVLPSEIGKVFPYRIEMDRDCRLQVVGGSLKRFLPDDFVGTSLWDHFDVLRPSVSQTPESVLENRELLFVLQSKKNPAFKLRGQLITPGGNLVFLVSPWVLGLKELEQIGLGVGDFAHVDPVVDFLFVIQSADMALQDAKRLNAKLTKQGADFKRATQLLALRQAVDRVLADELPLEQTVSHILRSLCENLNCDYAGNWTVSSDKRTLEYSGAFLRNEEEAQTFHSVSRTFKFRKGVGLPGRVWESRRPEWIRDVAHDENFPRRPYAAPLKGAFAFAIIRQHEVVGIIECLSKSVRDEDEEFRRVCEDVGHRIGDYMERRERDERLRSTTSQLMALIENLPSALLVEDAARRLTHANQEFCRMFSLDWSPTELVGTNCANLALAQREVFQDPARFMARVDEILSQRIAVKAEELPLANGGVVERDYIPIRLGDTYNGHVWVYRDISEKKKSERLLSQATEELLRSEKQAAENSSRAKSQFLSTMSHEIRTPMNAVIGMTSLLITTPLNKEQMHFVKTIKNAGSTLLAIINDVLDLAKIEAGKIDLRKVDFSLRETVQTVVDLFREGADARGVQLKAIFAADVPNYVEGDPDRLRQVLWNLVGNAIKFTQKGSVIIRATSMSNAGENSTMLFEVEDTGVGIAPESLTRLFTPFFQGDTSDRRKYYGTGLGLTITRQIVERMDGKIGVSSTLGKGSTFWFSVTMPVRKAPARTNAPPAQAPAPKGQEPISVLIVEDNEINREMAVAMLERLGHSCTTANDGRQALDITANSAFDLVLMDCQMPEMDGFEATQLIRERDAGKKRSLIVALTAGVLHEERERCIDAGMDDYLPKPVTVDDLEGLIARWRAKGTFAKSGLDEARLRSLRAIGPAGKRDLLSRMIDILLQTSPEMISEIEKALASESGRALKAAAHKLKGAAANLGMTRVADDCQALEKLAFAGDFLSARVTFARIKTEMESSTRNLVSHWREAA